MPKISVKITFDKAAAKAQIRAASDDALTVTGNQALEDTTKHVPKDQNYLRNSGLTNSDIQAQDMKFMLRWEEPYSQYLFHGKVMHGNPVNRTYGPEKLKFTEALARMEWTKYAHRVYGKDWKDVFRAALRRLL